MHGLTLERGFSHPGTFLPPELNLNVKVKLGIADQRGRLKTRFFTAATKAKMEPVLKMSFMPVLGLFLTITASAHSDLLSLNCENNITGIYATPTEIKCTLKAQAHLEINRLLWIKEGSPVKELIHFDGSKPNTTDSERFTLSKQDQNTDISLLLKNTRIEDEGTYKCIVMANAGHKEYQIYLKVEAGYSPPEMKKSATAVNCSTGGGYPKGELRWVDESGADLTSQAKSTFKVTDGGLIQLHSELNISLKTGYHSYTCIVLNSKGVEEGRDTLIIPEVEKQKVEDEQKNPSNHTGIIITICVILVALIIIAVLFMRWNRRPHFKLIQSVA
ncbi:CD276 antigen-like [Erpetoichthys calabaricus]|uniref:CD276 antigen-like n=1 Tax=Erpetoichthys calabaricus TaxID=27687 RepID=A0A8C4T289_ERPCA|nr:CD276 antigen-like [Erpetoichthys calabaricus]